MKLSKMYPSDKATIDFYESVFASLPVGIAIYDATGQCFFSTKKTAELVGARDVDAVLAQNYHRIQSWKDSGLYEAVIEARRDASMKRHTTFIRTTFGREAWLEFLVKPISEAERETLVLIIADITEIKASELKHLQDSRIDALTGVFNRRHFDEVLEDEARRCARADRPLSLIMLDIDHFKAYNDRFGHLAGDECLKAVSLTIQSALVRQTDLVVRYGGEEFVCILPYTETTGALVVAERIKAALQALRIPRGDSGTGEIVTISQGIHTSHPRSDPDLRSYVDGADQALYHSKRDGRNRISVE